MRVWDIKRATAALAQIQDCAGVAVTVEGTHEMAVNCLYAALFEPAVKALRLTQLPRSHRDGPDYLNVLRFMDIPQAVAMAAESCPVALLNSSPEPWAYPTGVASALHWPPDRLQIHSEER